MARSQKNKRRVALPALLINRNVYKKKIRNLGKGKWHQRWFLERKRLGSHVTILKELQKGSEIDLKSYIRMDPNTFHKLPEKVTPFIGKDTNVRKV